VTAVPSATSSGCTPDEHLDAVERQLREAAIEASGRNQSQTTRLVGNTPRRPMVLRALYESLGFRLRCPVHVATITHAASARGAVS